jgi:hypothetical protein
MLIIRIWLCCDLNCERTKEKLNKIKKKIFKCCFCCGNDEKFINSVNDNINLEDNDLNSDNDKEISEIDIKGRKPFNGNQERRIKYHDNIPRDIGIVNTTGKYSTQENIAEYDSIQINLKNKKNNIKNNVSFLYFPISSTKKTSIFSANRY